MNIEETLLQRISASNRRNLRVILGSVIVSIILIIVLFGSKIKKKVTNSTADIGIVYIYICVYLYVCKYVYMHVYI